MMGKSIQNRISYFEEYIAVSLEKRAYLNIKAGFEDNCLYIHTDKFKGMYRDYLAAKREAFLTKLYLGKRVPEEIKPFLEILAIMLADKYIEDLEGA